GPGADRGGPSAIGRTLLHGAAGLQQGHLRKPDCSLAASRAGGQRGWLEKMTALKRDDRYASAGAALKGLDEPPAETKTPWRIRWRMFWARFAEPRTPAWPEIVRLPPPRNRITL